MMRDVAGWSIALAGLVAWLGLLVFRGFFWRARERDDGPEASQDLFRPWPTVVAIVPARNEASVIEQSIVSLLAQDYPSRFHIILVDDQSGDGTAEIARWASRQVSARAEITFEIILGTRPPRGWTGKLWALQQGLVRSESVTKIIPDYYLLTDADIVHKRSNLRRLVACAEGRSLVLVSTMVRLRCRSIAERLLVPAFVFFFQMLYPFAWVNNGRRRTAAGAGGCMLVGRNALRAAGGFAAIRNEMIDDCALARRLKRQGPIWLGLTDFAASIRSYPGFWEIGRMVSRSAYAQLGFSPLNLVAVFAFMAVVFVTPVVSVLLSSGLPRLISIGVYAVMALAFQPMLRFYRRPAWYGLALPIIAAFYVAFTAHSAFQYLKGTGGMWKGRVQVR